MAFGQHQGQQEDRGNGHPNGGGRQSAEFQRLIAGRFQGLAQIDRPADWESYPHNFIYGQADPSLFDHQNWRLCAVQALGRREFETLTADYYEQDDPMLIEYILRNILPRRGIDARPSEVLVTMGAQNALWLAAQVLQWTLVQANQAAQPKNQ